MPTKPLPLIALVLIVPVAVLTFFAVRSLSLENDALTVRRERLAKQHMDAAAALVLTRIQGLGTEVLAQTRVAYATGGVEALSNLTRKRVFTYAFVSKLGTQLYSATALEHQYDSTRLLQDRAQALAAKLSAAEPSAEALVPYGGGYTFLRCSRSATDTDICVAIDKTKVAHVLRSGLGLAARSTGLKRVGLVDPNGIVIGLQDAEVLSIASQPLDGLLRGWQLRVEEPSSGDSSLLQNTLSLYFIAGALIAGWLAVTWMLHRSTVLKEEAAAARANVIAQLAHELRTPLANLKLHTDLLRRKSSDANSVQRYSAVLDGEIDRLTLLAENAIAVARGAIARPKLETAIPDDCLRAILDRFEPTLADARCSVDFAPSAAIASRFDRTSWERCIVNLIDNSCKYASGSVIKITTAQTSDMLRLDVSDCGPGIAADQREQIFKPLERVTTTKASGFGLGLAAVRALARQNGGDCWVEAVHPGAHFVLTMQARPVEALLQEQVSQC